MGRGDKCGCWPIGVGVGVGGRRGRGPPMGDVGVKCWGPPTAAGLRMVEVGAAMAVVVVCVVVVVRWF